MRKKTQMKSPSACKILLAFGGEFYDSNKDLTSECMWWEECLGIIVCGVARGDGF